MHPRGSYLAGFMREGLSQAGARPDQAKAKPDKAMVRSSFISNPLPGCSLSVETDLRVLELQVYLVLIGISQRMRVRTQAVSRKGDCILLQAQSRSASERALPCLDAWEHRTKMRGCQMG